MDDLPFLWYQWIRYQRNYPPTQQELDEYDDYLKSTQEKAARIKERDDRLRVENPEFYEEQKKKFEEVQEELTNRAQKEVIALFQSRENALRIAAENKVAKMKEADDVIQSERRRYEEAKFQKLQESFVDPKSSEPSEVKEPADEKEKVDPFKPGAWRPWADQDNDDNDDYVPQPGSPQNNNQSK